MYTYARVNREDSGIVCFAGLLEVDSVSGHKFLCLGNTRELHFRQQFLFIGWYNLIMPHSNKTITVTTLKFRTHATLEKGQHYQFIPRSDCKITIANSEDPDQGLRCLLHSYDKRFLIQIPDFRRVEMCFEQWKCVSTVDMCFEWWTCVSNRRMFLELQNISKLSYI